MNIWYLDTVAQDRKITMSQLVHIANVVCDNDLASRLFNLVYNVMTGRNSLGA